MTSKWSTSKTLGTFAPLPQAPTTCAVARPQKRGATPPKTLAQAGRSCLSMDEVGWLEVKIGQRLLFPIDPYSRELGRALLETEVQRAKLDRGKGDRGGWKAKQGSLLPGRKAR